MAREKKTFKSASYFSMQVLIFQLLFLLLICCQRVTSMQCIGQSIHLYMTTIHLCHIMMWHFVCPMSSAHDTELKQILCIEFPKAWHCENNFKHSYPSCTVLLYVLNLPYCLVYSYCCPGLQCGYEAGLSWRDGDLHLHCQPGFCSGLDCWAIHINCWSYTICTR